MLKSSDSNLGARWPNAHPPNWGGSASAEGPLSDLGHVGTIGLWHPGARTCRRADRVVHPGRWKAAGSLHRWRAGRLPLVAHHGTPAEATTFNDWHDACRRQVFRLNCASRAGLRGLFAACRAAKSRTTHATRQRCPTDRVNRNSWRLPGRARGRMRSPAQRRCRFYQAQSSMFWLPLRDTTITLLLCPAAVSASGRSGHHEGCQTREQ
jgi:hypothetical protein